MKPNLAHKPVIVNRFYIVTQEDGKPVVLTVVQQGNVMCNLLSLLLGVVGSVVL